VTPASVMLADCPWKFGDSLPGNSRGAAKQYDVLDVESLKAFPLPPMADTSILFFWRVSAMVEEAYQVVRAWGYVPKSEIVWEKLTKTGKPWFGMGRYVRASHETCIVGTRGSFKVKDRGVRSRFSAPVPTDSDGKIIHSAKPDEFYALIERLADGPYVELFARRRREGWEQFGNELPEVTP